MSADFSFLDSLGFVHSALAHLAPDGEHPHQFEALLELSDYIEERFKPHYRGLLETHKTEPERIGSTIKLNVPYYNQLDNNVDVLGPGGRQCNATCCAMLADHVTGGELSRAARARGEREAEAVYDDYVAKFGDTTSHDAQTEALRMWGITSYWDTQLSRSQIVEQLERNIPVIVGVRYKGSGHIILIVGHNPDEEFFWVHDPFGVRKGASNVYDNTKSGAYDKYSYELMEKLWNFGPGGTGWGRIVTRIQAVVPAPMRVGGMLS